jgi:cell wall-associated NlpC family hydrolase
MSFLLKSPLARALTAVVALTSAACASTGGTPRPFPMPGATTIHARRSAPPPVRAGSTEHNAVVTLALELRGVPYRNGGTDLNGFDCSGFTQYVFAHHGLTLPREVREQFRLGKKIKRERMQPGDLIFFTTTGPGPSHVAIAVGGDEFVHAPSSRGVVRVERMSSRYWASRLIGIRRIGAN